MMSLALLTQDEVARCCAPSDDDEPGFGALATPSGNLPLKLLHVHTQVVGLVAETTVRQTFVNTLSTPLEATYIFPLPDRAAVSRFRLEVGERVIEGTLKERGAARREYDQAIATGHRAAITEEERPGVFTMRVGNLMPGEEASVHLTLAGPVTFAEGEATFRFPLVVAPRYIPGTALAGEQVGDGTAADTDAVPDASRISPPVLLPGFPNPVRLALTVEVDPAGVRLSGVRSSLHAVSETAVGGGVLVRLQPGERLDRDFVLRWSLGADAVQTGLTLHPDADGEGEGTFQLTLVPPAGLAKTVAPRDVVFVLDRSGSMGGWKMVAARRACARMLDTLTDQDRFAVLAFDHGVERPARLEPRGLTAASDRNRFKAVEFLAGLEARGGTEMAQPLEQAVDDLLAEGSGAERDRVLILITDGQVGNEDQILRTLGARLANLRVFTLGIDRAVNAGFLRRLAATGGGYCELVESEDRLDDVMDKVHRRIGTPLLTNLTIEGAGLSLIDGTLAPARLPDLFAGTPLRILGRYRGAGTGSLAVSAQDGVGMRWTETVAGEARDTGSVTRVWARGRIRDLEDRYAVTSDRALVPTITNTSLRFGVMCKFTSFVAVDRSEVVNEGGQVHAVTQAVEQPSGWGEEQKQNVAPPVQGRFRTASKRSSSPPPSLLDGLVKGGFTGVPQSITSDPFAAPSAMPPAPAGGDPFAAPAESAPFGGANAFGDGGGDPFADAFAAPGSDPFAASSDPFAPPANIVFDSSDEAGDDLLLEFEEQDLAPPPPPARKPMPSRGRKRKAGKKELRRDSAPKTPAQDALGTYRRRVQELLTLLKAEAQAVLGLRQRELAKLVLQLETLLEDLRSVGTDEGRLRPLISLFEDLLVVRGEQLDEATLSELETRAREVLQTFLDTPGADPASGRRGGGFWF